MTVISHSQAETEQFGRSLAGRLGDRRIVLLRGELGAGKTSLTRGLAVGLGVKDPGVVHSPSFSLVNQYQLNCGTLYHVDLYRLESARDLYSIGLEEILFGEHWVVVEWAEKIPWKIDDAVTIDLTVGGNESRIIDVKGIGSS